MASLKCFPVKSHRKAKTTTTIPKTTACTGLSSTFYSMLTTSMFHIKGQNGPKLKMLGDYRYTAHIKTI